MKPVWDWVFWSNNWPKEVQASNIHARLKDLGRFNNYLHGRKPYHEEVEGATSHCKWNLCKNLPICK